MKNLIVLALISAALISCAHNEKRTKFSDKNMRVKIDPDSVPVAHHVRIQNALVASGAFSVIDGAKGMKAIKKEQELMHRQQVDRYDDREKWAHWGKLYGVGAIIVGHVQCYSKESFWNPGKSTKYCAQFLTMVDANTGEVIVSVEDKAEVEAGRVYGGYEMTPSWDGAVEKLVKAYPKDFKFTPYTQRLVEYQDISEEAAVRQKRELAEEQAGK